MRSLSRSAIVLLPACALLLGACGSASGSPAAPDHEAAGSGGLSAAAGRTGGAGASSTAGGSGGAAEAGQGGTGGGGGQAGAAGGAGASSGAGGAVPQGGASSAAGTSSQAGTGGAGGASAHGGTSNAAGTSSQAGTGGAGAAGMEGAGPAGSGGTTGTAGTGGAGPLTLGFSATTLGADMDPAAIVSTDFNGDGAPDLAVGDGKTGVTLLLGKGDGTFQLSSALVATQLVWDLAVGDVNGDGQADLVVLSSNAPPFESSGTPANYIVLLSGGKAGGFSTMTPVSSGDVTQGVLLVDVNKDGRLDLLVSNQGSGTVGVLLGNGDGTFGAESDFPCGALPSRPATADFNGDGEIDLVVANDNNDSNTPDANTVSILLGNGDGTFQAPVSYAADDAPDAVVTGDFNHDGHIDVAEANHSLLNPGHGDDVGVLLGKGDGTFQATTFFPVGELPTNLVAADFDQDGNLDLAVLDSGSNDVSVALGTGDGTFASPVTFPVGMYPFSLVTSDFNRDGLPDLATSNNDDGTLSILLNTSHP